MPAFVDPLIMSPRLDYKPWGGSRLTKFGYLSEGSQPLGEIVATATTNRIADGEHAGETLESLIAADPYAMIGPLGLATTRNQAVFPLLVKFIDAAEHLSVQVHPDDARGAAISSLGKTEAWHVLDAVPTSTLFAGVETGITAEHLEVAARRADGSTALSLRRVPAQTGDTLLLPAGTVHALGAGVMVYEIQQASEITYRLDDWGRLGLDGKPRELHIAQSLDAMDLTLRPSPLRPVRLLGGDATRELLTACRYFALDRFTFRKSGSAIASATGGPQVITAILGSVSLRGTQDHARPVELATGQTAVVPAATAQVEISAAAEAVVLRGWVPNLSTEVIEPSLDSGADIHDVAMLSSPLVDVAAAMNADQLARLEQTVRRSEGA